MRIVIANVSVLKRGNVYQYKFEVANVDVKRKFRNKSGFKTKAEAENISIEEFVKVTKKQNL